MADPKRCPRCGGLNPIDAEWCGQCHARFATAPPPPPPPADPLEVDLEGLGIDPADPLGSETVADRTPESVGRSSSDPVTRGAFTVAENAITWRCPTCDNENPLGSQICEVCGSPFAEVVREPEPERKPSDPNLAALLSLLLPGAGHYYVGKTGEAIARAVLSVWVVIVAVAAAVGGRGTFAIFGTIVFALAGFALWGAAAHDAYREARGEGALAVIKGRMYLYIVLGLLSLLMLMLVTAILGARV